MINFYWGGKGLCPPQIQNLKQKYLSVILRGESGAYEFTKSICFALTLIFMCLLNSALAQSRLPVGAVEERVEITPLVVGQKVPEEFWTREHLFYINGDTVRKTLEKHKGKLLVLDFWFIGCSTCLLHQREIVKMKERYPNELSVVMVNNLPKWDNIDAFNSFYQNRRYLNFGMHDFQSIIYDNFLYETFGASAYPLYVWISTKGMVRVVTNVNLFDQKYIMPLIERSNVE